jgi:hypothetical protein
MKAQSMSLRQEPQQIKPESRIDYPLPMAMPRGKCHDYVNSAAAREVMWGAPKFVQPRERFEPTPAPASWEEPEVWGDQ